MDFQPNPNPHAGFVPPPVETSNQAWATVIGATTWFWIMYRFKQDGGVLFVRRKNGVMG